MDLSSLYHKTDRILDQLDFDKLFPGFYKYQFALYNSEQICLNGSLIPYTPAFRGNTSLLFDDNYIAIWNIESDYIDDPELLAYNLVHEMFHCHQNNLSEARFPADLVILQYPNDLDNYIKKYNENCFLVKAYAEQDLASFQSFYAIREQRLRVCPAFVRQELYTETIEGFAEYIGLKALQQIAPTKYNAEIQQILKTLSVESDLLFDIRRISYYTGTIYLLLLDLFGFEIQNDISSAKSVYEQNRIPHKDTPNLQPVPSLAFRLECLLHERQRLLDQHLLSHHFSPFLSCICAYDPMNMFRKDDLIYCSHFIGLKHDDQTTTLKGPVVLKMASGSSSSVLGYYG